MFRLGIDSRRTVVMLIGMTMALIGLPGLAASTAAADPRYEVMNAPEGVYWRSEPNWAAAERTTGFGVYNGTIIEVHCYQSGTTVEGSADTMWEQATDVGGRGYGSGWVNEHFINDGQPINQPSPGVGPCNSSPPPPPPPPVTPGSGGSGSSDGGPTGSTPPPTSSYSGDPCIPRYPSGLQKTKNVFGGKETLYDRQSSLYHVCEGFGAPESFHFTLTPTMQCALIAAAATYGGPVGNAGASRGCDLVNVASALSSGHWLGAASSKACGYFSDIFAGGVGVFVAGAASETGPGAVAVGVKTYQALAASLKVVCGGVFNGLGTALGKKLEADHETHIAIDVTRHGKCIKLNHVFGQWSWSATTCS